MAGFRGPLFLLGLSAAVAVTQAGYRSALPIPNLAGSTPTTQAGFVGPIPFINLGATDAVIPPVTPGGGGGNGGGSAGGPGKYRPWSGVEGRGERITIVDELPVIPPPEVYIDDVRYVHGDKSGKPRTAAKRDMVSTVSGHYHTDMYVEFFFGVEKVIFAMAVGCGIDTSSHAMAYMEGGKQAAMGCGVVIDGEIAFNVPMYL